MSSDDLRRIMLVTGSRAEYDILFSVAENLRRRPDVEIGFFVTGSHISPFHGMTVTEIRDDAMPIWAELPSLLAADGMGARPRGLGMLIGHLVTVLEDQKPDVVLACGDREEVLASAIACAYMNIVFCHYSAGDEAFDGNIDNSVRHAASKLAHVMMVTHPAHKRLLEACGEDPERIHVVGNAGLDRIACVPELSDDDLRLNLPYSLPENPRATVIHHSTSMTVETAAEELDAIFVALERVGVNALVSYPNSDAGNVGIRRVIDERRDQLSGVHHNLDRVTFVNLIRQSRLIIGNSSMGIIEAPSFGVPAVNVGVRQKGRLAGGHVIWCDPDVQQIERAILRAIDPAFRGSIPAENPYGDGRSGARIAELLASLALDDTLRFKSFRRLKGVFTS